MAKRKNRRTFPAIGYLLINGAFALFLAIGYYVASILSAKGNYVLMGVLPLLVFVFFCFVIVSIFDYVFDRLSNSVAPSDRSGQ
jgi:type III secretory pathway component EscU